jgi:hypothetical protein
MTTASRWFRAETRTEICLTLYPTLPMYLTLLRRPPREAARRRRSSRCP